MRSSAVSGRGKYNSGGESNLGILWNPLPLIAFSFRLLVLLNLKILATDIPFKARFLMKPISSFLGAFRLYDVDNDGYITRYL